MMYGERREVARCRLELYVLFCIILGRLTWNPSWGTWFWRSKDDNDLIILRDWIEPNKGAGSYFAMRNLIMFSEARFTGKSEAASLRKIDTDAAKYGADEEGWRMLGVLKQLIAESNISVDGKLCVWAEESAFRKAINKACKESGK